MRNRNNKQNKRKVKEDKKMNKREDKKEKEKHDSRPPRTSQHWKNGWEAEVPKTEKTFLQISLVNFFLKIFRSMNIL